MRAKENTVPATEPVQDRKIVNLKFLDDFIKRMDISHVQIAEAMNVSRQAVGFWFIHDDAAISKLQAIFDAFGYSLNFWFEQNQTADGDNKANVQMKLALKNDELIFGPRLDFLNKAIRTFKLNKVELSQKMKISKTTIYYWQSHDDCLISNLYAFAKYAGLHLNIEISPKEELEEVREFKDDITEVEEAPQEVIEERYEEIVRYIKMIDVIYDGFIIDAEKMIAGDHSCGTRVRRISLQLADMLKEYRQLSLDAEK